MKWILLPTDFSTNARNAMFYALSFYGSESAHYILINTFYMPYVGYDLPPTMNELAEENATVSFKDLLQRIERAYPNERFSIETEFKLGMTEGVITSFARQKKIDMIVMGTQGSSGFLDDLIGSHTTALMKTISCPLLAIPERCTYTPPSKIVLALNPDYNEEISVISLTPLLEIAEEYDVEIIILYVLEHERRHHINNTRLEQHLKGVNHAYQTLYSESPAEGIDNFIKENDISMLALLRHKHNIFEMLFHKSITKKMALHSKIPLLVLHSET